MKTTDLASLWLRDRALELRHAANRADDAYSADTPLGKATRYVAVKYREAAVLLDDAANDVEDGNVSFSDDAP